MPMLRTVLEMELEVPSDDYVAYRDRKNREMLGRLFNLDMSKTKEYFNPRKVVDENAKYFRELLTPGEKPDVLKWLNEIRE
jgi:hypothetical protein